MGNCDAQFGKVKRLVISNEKSWHFENEYIYLSFFSYEGLSLEVAATFPDEDPKEAERRRKRKSEADDEEEEGLFKEIYEPPPREDFMHNNIIKVKAWW